MLPQMKLELAFQRKLEQVLLLCRELLPTQPLENSILGDIFMSQAFIFFGLKYTFLNYRMDEGARLKELDKGSLLP